MHIQRYNEELIEPGNLYNYHAVDPKGASSLGNPNQFYGAGLNVNVSDSPLEIASQNSALMKLKYDTGGYSFVSKLLEMERLKLSK